MAFDMRLLIQLLLCLHLLGPALAYAQTARDPLTESVKTWLFVLAWTLIAGLADWFSEVRKGRLAYYNFAALVGHLTIAVFAGLSVHLLCEWRGFDRSLGACLSGLAGHMGGRAISLIERYGARRVMRELGTAPMPLDEPRA